MTRGCSLLAWAVFMSTSPASEPKPRLLQEQGPAKLFSAAPVEGQSLRIALTDSLPLTLEIPGTAAREVRIPQPIIASRTWREFSRSPIRRPGQAATWQQVFVLVPLAEGEHTLQLAPIQISDGAGSWQTITFQPISVRVTTSLVDPDPQSLRDITAVETLPAPTAPKLWPWLWLVGVAAVALASGLVWWTWRRQGPAAPLAYHAWTLARLDRLAARRLPAKGRQGELHALLAHLMRSYLARRFNVAARRLTTPELTQALSACPELKEEEQRLFLQLLEQCDLARFARQQVSPEECAARLECARHCIEATAPPP